MVNERSEKGDIPAVTPGDIDENQAARSNRALFRIARALPNFRRINQLLNFITREVQDLIGVEGASVILLDEKKQEFYFPVATYDDASTGRKMKEIRFPADSGVAGQVYRTGRPMIVPDTSKNPHFLHKVDEQSEYRTRNMLDVPIRVQDHMIGVLCAVNKKDSRFDQEDVELLSTIASTAALPIENARINEALNRSYEEVQGLNRAKDRVIHHLSHELKTPVSVLTTSLNLIEKKLARRIDPNWQRLLDRMRRNLDRILEMQYEIEDILKDRDYRVHNMISTLLDACSDALEALAFESLSADDIVATIRQGIDRLFGPREAVSQSIHLGRFVKTAINEQRPLFDHRSCKLTVRSAYVPPIMIPPEILEKICTGLVRNAIESTPDGGRIDVMISNGVRGPELVVKDFGIGITDANQELIFESNFSTAETSDYASRNRYDFNAGGKGFDLLRTKIFSERYRFVIEMISNRCRFIPGETDLCPGDITKCRHCRTAEDCFQSGGTTMMLTFRPATTGDV